MRQMTGKQSISFAKAVYIEGSAAIVGEKEKDGPLGEYFSHTLSDPMCGQESWEEGESELQLATAKLAMQKANVRPEQIRMIFAGDLLAQSIASSFGLVDLNCPLYGLFGACSTMGEALSLGAMAVAGGYGDRVRKDGVPGGGRWLGATLERRRRSSVFRSPTETSARRPRAGR